MKLEYKELGMSTDREFPAHHELVSIAGNACVASNSVGYPNKLTLDAIRNAERRIGLNGPFESLDEMLRALKDDSDNSRKGN